MLLRHASRHACAEALQVFASFQKLFLQTLQAVSTVLCISTVTQHSAHAKSPTTVVQITAFCIAVFAAARKLLLVFTFCRLPLWHALHVHFNSLPFRPHRMQSIDATYSCACLDILWSVYLSVCLVTAVSCAKTAEPIEVSFGAQTHVPNGVFDDGPDPSQETAILGNDIAIFPHVFDQRSDWPAVHSHVSH